MPLPSYYLGCPVWACEGWKGTLFTHDAPRLAWLEQYASVFNAVEGNSTFYALPSLETAQRWADSVPPGFRFVLKFPQTISHKKRLLGAEPETAAFLEILEVLDRADCLGPAFLQLPRGFPPHHLADLDAYLQALPTAFHYAVEVRHQAFFDGAKQEGALNQLLAARRVERVIFDSRALFSADASDPSENESQHRKPNLPVHRTVIGRHPILRFVGRNDLPRNLPWIHEWAPEIARWINNGIAPFVFTHSPDERFAPAFARLLHDEIARHVELDPLPVWPGEAEPKQPKQLDLF